jgi:hypothetical protein
MCPDHGQWGNEQTKADVRSRMRFRQTDCNLAGLREPAVLEALAPDDQAECLALWHEIVAVLGNPPQNCYTFNGLAGVLPGFGELSGQIDRQRSSIEKETIGVRRGAGEKIPSGGRWFSPPPLRA